MARAGSAALTSDDPGGNDDNELCADPVSRDGRDRRSSCSPTGCLRQAAARRTRREPWWIEYPKSFFPVLLIVFLLRSFVAEPFKIPSSSMRPTLEVGDFILVNKFAYGLRLPIVEEKIIPDRRPEARRRRRVPLSGESVAGFHQAGRRF